MFFFLPSLLDGIILITSQDFELIFPLIWDSYFLKKIFMDWILYCLNNFLTCFLVCNFQRRRLRSKLDGHSLRVMSLDFHPMRTDLLYSSDSNNEMRIWNFQSNTCTHIAQVIKFVFIWFSGNLDLLQRKSWNFIWCQLWAIWFLMQAEGFDLLLFFFFFFSISSFFGLFVTVLTVPSIMYISMYEYTGGEVIFSLFDDQTTGNWWTT